MFALADQQLADWPPAVTEQVHGWLLRATPGVLRHRSTSALPPHTGATAHLDEVLDRAAAFAGQHDQPLGIQIHSWQTELDRELVRRGWVAEADALVMAGPADAIARPDHGVVEGLDDGWLAIHQEVEGRTDVEATVQQVFARLGDRARFLQVPGEAVVLAVDSPDLVGVYSLATRPEARGRGAATRLMRAAAAGAPGRTLYLQVWGQNPAVALYHRLGLREVGGYHYRTPPVSAPAAPGRRP